MRACGCPDIKGFDRGAGLRKRFNHEDTTFTKGFTKKKL